MDDEGCDNEPVTVFLPPAAAILSCILLFRQVILLLFADRLPLLGADRLPLLGTLKTSRTRCYNVLSISRVLLTPLQIYILSSVDDTRVSWLSCWIYLLLLSFINICAKGCFEGHLLSLSFAFSISQYLRHLCLQNQPVLTIDLHGLNGFFQLAITFTFCGISVIIAIHQALMHYQDHHPTPRSDGKVLETSPLMPDV